MHFKNLRFIHTFLQSLEPDLNYASLDLKVKKKPKRVHRRSPAQGCNNMQEQVMVPLTPPLNAFLEVDINMDAQLPATDESSMVSHSSIYLNTQQIAKEAEDMERGQSVNVEEDGFNWMIRDQEGEESENRKDSSNRNICIEAQDRHGDTDHFINSSKGV